VLQLGHIIEQSVVDEVDFPQLVVAQVDKTRSDNASLVIDPAFLPFAPNSLSSVLLPHVLEGHELPHQVLREAHRVLMSEGHLVLTGFNPVSFIGLQRLVRRRAVYDGHYYTVRRVADWLQLLGFEMVGSAMFQYAPLSKSQRVRKYLAFLNSVGDRWLPMIGGGYMIVAKKRDPGMNLVGRIRFRRSKRRKLVSAAPAKTVVEKSI